MRNYYTSEKWELCTCNLCVLLKTVSEEKGEPVGDWPGDLTLRNPPPA